ncbi:MULTISPECIES: hypothetical protein [Leptolyngbya]|uniref:hypothetical protein n=1 Tax=Leptolyngbya TaxID=47251 RepID=UPI001684811F|nr:hypothetical protein [Leptolyngbya sp. FACHB-1624]
MFWNSNDELRQEVTRLKQKIEELENSCECNSSTEEQDRILDFEQIRKQIEESRQERDLNDIWDGDQERREHLENLKNQDFLLNRTDLYDFEQEDTTSEDRRKITINWEGVSFVLVMILAWFWFNRPVEPRFESQSDRIQTTQTVR